jgi:predicted PurR-regulated permease PerM
MDGDRMLYYMLYYLPLNDEDETRLLSRFNSVTRATLKGTAVIGLLQGGLAGLALWAAGIPSALFWSVTMMLLSVVPGIGTALVWIPAVIYLMVGGHYAAAVAVSVFCILVVGTVDNVLRPKLVGSDTQLHELMIFFSTLGGLLAFGFWGFVIGPIIAALFVTVWELYGAEFRDWLPTTAYTPRNGTVDLPHQRLERGAVDQQPGGRDEGQRK